ncbi:DUF2470 domain-containing protein [Nocardiopsis sp. NPDC049922]|uniref:DUF2470 domain-containing protein n=1 Tax=Nocardiopsis sp. NPDC049922 TaxID=3155157 RepID=UPI0033CAE2F1
MRAFRRALEPSPAERARSVLARPNPATVTTADLSVDLPAPVCHTGPDDEITLLVPDGHPILNEVGAGSLEATVEFIDVAPLDLRDPTRSLLWISGELGVPDPDEARELALNVLAADPDERLLDLGHGFTMVVLAPHLIVHSAQDGCHLLHPGEFGRARPDPFGRWEGPWLRHLEEAHADLLYALLEWCDTPLPDGRPRPLGVDRFGLLLRLESADGDHDVRIPFRRPARTPHDVAHEVHVLAGIAHHR